MPDDDGIVTITARDIYLELRSLSQDVQRIGQTMGSNARRLDDLEQRIRRVYTVSLTAIATTTTAIAAMVQITNK
ncbi:hypothetical protein ACFYZH_09980 [Streptomyces abikoensis]|uniref:hypothetical protein n=1 Tax=Streptomyces abikoensis TaxID=97398 RepID=UPI0036A245F3